MLIRKLKKNKITTLPMFWSDNAAAKAYYATWYQKYEEAYDYDIMLDPKINDWNLIEAYLKEPPPTGDQSSLNK